MGADPDRWYIFVDCRQPCELLQLKRNIEHTEVHDKAPVQELGDCTRI